MSKREREREREREEGGVREGEREKEGEGDQNIVFSKYELLETESGRFHYIPRKKGYVGYVSKKSLNQNVISYCVVIIIRR